MFTGIIESKGKVIAMDKQGTNVTFTIESSIAKELKVDQSVAHDGVCLTVVEVDGNQYKVTAIEETLKRSNLGSWEKGHAVNQERCMLNNGRFDGHIVQGHVDQKGEVVSVEEKDGSWLFRIKYPDTEHVMVEKGSITVNGISLTCFDCHDNGFSVAIIPYTFENTNLGTLNPGDSVNLEFDIVGKYVQKMIVK